LTLTLVSFVGCYSAFELEVETVKGEMVTRLSNRLVGHPPAKD
jgi:hypothetical protein